ncbi:MAG: RimK/LysX family protein [Candidatus Limnocylindrales bacterium]
MNVKSRPARTSVGWREWLALPDWGVEAIKAKIDTGARTSALHAFDIETFERDGVAQARFAIHPWQDSSSDVVVVEAPLLERREVRSSSGAAKLRPVVLTTMELAGRREPIEVTLTRRDEMGFRMLIGRQALRRRFVVDPGRSYLGGRPARDIIDRNRGRS